MTAELQSPVQTEVSRSLILTLAELPADMSALDGKTFQVHLLPSIASAIGEQPMRLRLYPVTITVDTRCPVIVGGERCGRKVGHDGKHMWGGGD